MKTVQPGAWPATPAARVRDFEPADAEQVSALFRAVYGEHYVYPDVYLPSQIVRHHASGQWRSAVAVNAGRVLGHATLWRTSARPDQAELALNVVHPDARGQGLASLLGRRLIEVAIDLGVGMLTIKQVCAHPQSQHLARALGFSSTALLLDYVDSPFGGSQAESIVFGCLPLRPCPLPSLPWPASWQAWLNPLRRAFGEAVHLPGPADAQPAVTLHRQGRGLELVLPRPDAAGLAELAGLPAGRPVHLRLPAEAQTLALAPLLARLGFGCAGVLPATGGDWQMLWWRGRREGGALHLCDPAALSLYQVCQGAGCLPGARESVRHAPVDATSALAGAPA